MLEIRDLHASVAGKEILKGVNLTVREGEVHALMGQNGAGKSTLSNVIVGHPAYKVTQGEIRWNGKDLLTMSPEELVPATRGDTGRVDGELHACCLECQA